MKNKLVVLIAEVQYPSRKDVTYLTANAYQVGNVEEYENARNDFVHNCEMDGFKIVNFLPYQLPIQPLLSMWLFQLIFNNVQKPPNPVCDDDGSKG